MSEYPRTLEAVRRYEGGAWEIADALVAEIETTATGSARQGEWPRVQKFLADNGFEYGAEYLRLLYTTARWAADSDLEVRIRSYSARSVREARSKAKGDHAKALAILEKHGGKLHKISGTTSLGRAAMLDDEQAQKVADDLAVHHPRAVAGAVARQPSAARAIAANRQAREHVDMERERNLRAPGHVAGSIVTGSDHPLGILVPIGRGSQRCLDGAREMVGEWQDHWLDADDEEREAARRLMARTADEVAEIVRAALKIGQHSAA